MCQMPDRPELLLPSPTDSPARARSFARAHGCTEHAAQVLDDALLLISELITNSVLHGGPPILLAIECDGEGLRVRVRDGSTTLPQARNALSGDEGGRGLTLVDLLTDTWGVDPVEDEHGIGKAVWFELRKGERQGA